MRESAFQALMQRKTVARTMGDRYLVLSGPIAAGSEQLGTLEIAFDQAPQQAVLASVKRVLLVIMIGLLVGTVLVSVALTRYAVKPLQLLATVADKIGKGNLEAQVPVCGTRETAILGNAVERMRVELQGLYLGLEQQVVERNAY